MTQKSPNPAAASAVETPFLSDVTECDRWLDLFSVTCFAVIDPRIDGTTQHQTPISPCFATREQAKSFKRQKQAAYPHCFIAAFENEFNSEDEAGRLELLTQIIGTDTGALPLPGEFGVRSFIVVQGSEDDPAGTTPISPFFPSHEQAIAFLAVSRVFAPDSRILTQDHAAEDDADRQRLIAMLFGKPAPGVPQTLAPQLLFMAFTAFAVVAGEGAGRQHMPLGPYFRTLTEVEQFQVEIRAQYPHCRIARQRFVPEDAPERDGLLQQLFGREG